VSKGILFLSIMDFTDSGIQVVKLSPEYFAKHGWNVHYVVTRDNSKNGSYHYQDVINPLGITVHRTAMPSWWLGERLKNHILKTIYSKLRGYVAIAKLAWYGRKVLRNSKIDVVYGGGPHGVLAANLIRFFTFGRTISIVSRFYGTFLAEKILKKNSIGIVLNWDEYLAFRLTRNMAIITNDGTRGDVAMRTICPDKLNNMRFWVNGVDLMVDRCKPIQTLDAITICRLVSWKRVDRALLCVSKIVNQFGMKDFKYHIVGDGPELSSLISLSQEFGLENNVIFHGALKHDAALELLLSTGIYISTYDLSNVGNPLLEAIRANKIIFTLNNGDTSSWIEHGVNGFIYDIDDSMLDRMAQDIVALARNTVLHDTIKQNIRLTELEKLWTWDERLQAEFSEVEKLVEERT
jgi:glycosyltransferase involved in cell wall biosynthesis